MESDNVKGTSARSSPSFLVQERTYPFPFEHWDGILDEDTLAGRIQASLSRCAAGTVFVLTLSLNITQLHGPSRARSHASRLAESDWQPGVQVGRVWQGQNSGLSPLPLCLSLGTPRACRRPGRRALLAIPRGSRQQVPHRVCVPVHPAHGGSASLHPEEAQAVGAAAEDESNCTSAKDHTATLEEWPCDFLVGARGFEPPTSRTRTVRASRSALRPVGIPGPLATAIIPHLRRIDKCPTLGCRTAFSAQSPGLRDTHAKVAEFCSV